MSYFEKILIPIDFTINTEVAIKKAMHLVAPGISEVFLLHVSQIGVRSAAANGFSFTYSVNARSAEEKLQEVKRNFENSIQDVVVKALIKVGANVENEIISFANEIKCSLIIIGKNNQHSFFPFLNTVISPNVADETGCAVLTVKPGSLKKGLNTIVVPIPDFFPRRKIDMLLTLGSRIQLNIHLLTILNNHQYPDDCSASALLQSLRSLRNKLKYNVQHSVIHSNSKAIATLRYAEKVNADMLLVNPETEATINTWISKKDITDVLKPASQLQVLSVKPY